MCYSLWYNATTMFTVAGSLETPLPGYRPATWWVHYTTCCNTQSNAPEDGRDQRPKHVELIGIINKPLLLHLVSVYIIYMKVYLQQSRAFIYSTALLSVSRMNYFFVFQVVSLVDHRRYKLISCLLL